MAIEALERSPGIARRISGEPISIMSRQYSDLVAEIFFYHCQNRGITAEDVRMGRGKNSSAVILDVVRWVDALEIPISLVTLGKVLNRNHSTILHHKNKLMHEKETEGLRNTIRTIVENQIPHEMNTDSFFSHS